MKSRHCCVHMLFLAFLLLSIPRQASAQSNDIGSLIDASVNDATVISRAYLTPMIKGIGTGLNTGWIHSGSPGDFPHFYISVQSGMAFIPSPEHRFDVTALNLENLHYLSGPVMAPTANGPDRDGPTMQISKVSNGTTYQLGELTLPSGSGLNFAPAPVIQIGAGLLFNTNLMIRFVPKVIVDNASVYMNGIGIQHGINQWIPGGQALPVDLSVMFGYTIIKGRYNLDVTPENDPDVINTYHARTWDNQYIRTRTTALTFNIVAGKRISVFNLYAGLGYESSKTSLGTIGNYPSRVPDPQPGNPYQQRIQAIVNPIGFKVNGARTTHLLLGTGVDLKYFKFFADYTISVYPTLSFGIGFGY